MLHQLVIKMTKADKEFWSTFARKLHCKDTTEFARKLTVIMKTTPTGEFREWFYSRLAKAGEDENAPVSRILRTIIEYAVKDGADEIHVVPRQTDSSDERTGADTPLELAMQNSLYVHIMYRFGDELREQMRVPGYVHEPLATLVRSRAGLWEEDGPQHGHLSVDVGQTNYRWPVSLLPTDLGDQIVIQVAPR
jgi:type II secretory ATPase GspE/PulE/Tfp pilus assembly ATPase PilB-like protein